jgi:hypothetical protein
VKAYLPNATAATIQRLTEEIIQETEPLIYSTARQLACKEREKAYISNKGQ